jgi:hypothetical protein
MSWPSDADEVPSHTDSHRVDGSDEVASDTPVAAAIPRTGTSGILNAWLTAALKGDARPRPPGPTISCACSQLTRSPVAAAVNRCCSGAW